MLCRESPHVELVSVTAGYGRSPALRGVTAGMQGGVVNAVLGPNGSGKSTLLDVIAGVLAPAAGRVRGVTGRLAYVSQHVGVGERLPMTVRNVVAMGRWAHRGPWRPLLPRDRAVVAESMDRMEIGHLADTQIGELSGGQRHRVLIARGLAQQADLLLLDEPSAGLDWAADAMVRAVLDDETRRGVTVVHATHDVRSALTAQHCLLLDCGQLVASGKPDAVLTESSIASVWRIPARSVLAPPAERSVSATRTGVAVAF